MQFGKLALVLKNLQPLQLKRLRKFVHSPYFGVSSASVAVYERLQKMSPHFTEQKLSARAIARWHPQLKTIKQQETAGVRLLRAIEKFLELEEAQNQPPQPNVPLLIALRQMELATEFTRQLKKSQHALAHEPEQNIETFYGKHLTTELQLNGFDARLNRSSANSILPVMKTLDEYYALKKLRYLCEALSRQISLGADTTYHDQHIPTLLKILQPYTNQQHPYVYLFVNVYKMLSSTAYADGEIYYGLIKQYVVEHSKNKKVSQSIKEAVNYTYEHCIQWYNKGSVKAGEEFLWWVEWKQKHGLLLENGKLMPPAFLNMVNASLLLRPPKQTEQFIKNYAAYLPKNFRPSHSAFANGLLQYHQKQHAKAARFFVQAQAGTDWLFSCIIRRWQFINLYEGNPADTDILFSQLDSFEKHLLRYKKQLPHVYAQLAPFIKYAGLLLKFEVPEINLLQLQAEPHFAGKPWLLQQWPLKNKKPVRQAHGQKVSSR